MGIFEIGVSPVGLVLTGPPYPPPLPAGSNALGSLEVGISAVGTIPPFNPWNTIISQYANSPRLTGMINNFFAAVDPTANIDAFFSDIWDVDTAQGYGLDVWGRIVNIPRSIEVVTANYFGFSEQGSTSQPFGQAPFFNGEALTTNYEVTDPVYYRMIIGKAMTNISDGSIPSINAILRELFPNRGGNAYVQDGAPFGPYFGFSEAGNTCVGFNQAPFYHGQPILRMQMAYVFNFDLTPVDLAIVSTPGLLPKPTGVQSSIVVTPNTL